MDYVAENMVLVILLLVLHLYLVCGECSVDSETLRRARLEDTISYTAAKLDNCVWSLPTIPPQGGALIIDMKSLTMSYIRKGVRYCSGKIAIAGSEPFCQSRTFCKIYAPPGLSCDMKQFHDLHLDKFFDCEWQTTDSPPGNITLTSTQWYHKSFNIYYRVVPCAAGGKSREAAVPATTTPSVTTEGLNPYGNRTETSKGDDPTSKDSVCQGTMHWVFIIVALVATVAALIAFIFFQHRRISKMQSDYLDAVVRHSAYVRRTGSLHPELLYDSGGGPDRHGSPAMEEDKLLSQGGGGFPPEPTNGVAAVENDTVESPGKTFLNT